MRTRNTKNNNRLGLKYKRRPPAHRLVGINSRLNGICKTPEEIEKYANNGVTDADVFKLSNQFFDSVLENTGSDKLDLGSRRSSSNFKGSNKYPTNQKVKRRSLRDVSDNSVEINGGELKEYRGSKKSIISAIRQESTFTTTPKRVMISSIQFPNDFQLSSSVLAFIEDYLNDCLNYADKNEFSSTGEKSVLAAFHTLLNMVQHSQYVPDVVFLLKSIVPLIGKYLSSPKIIWFGCMITEKVIGESTDTTFLMRGDMFSKIENVILELLKNHKNLAEIQIAGIKVLWTIAETKESQHRIVNPIILKLIIMSMDKFDGNSEVQYVCCAVLQKLAVENSNEENIGKFGAIQRILKAALSLSLNKDVVRKACAALWNLSFHDRNKKKMISGGHYKQIAEIVQVYSQVNAASRPDIVSKACGVIWNLADSLEGKVKLLEHKVDKLIVDTMKTFRFDEKVQEMGCGCLRSLAYDDSSRIGLMSIGAAEKILESMKDHVKHQGIQYQAFAVLKKLSCNDVNEGRLIRMNAGERILEAMDAHITIACIQERACGVLWNLAVNDGHKVKLVGIGCAEKMLKAMQEHKKNEQVQFQTCRTLKRLARDSNNEVHLMRLGAAKHVLEAMKNHMGSASIQEKGCGVLWNLSERDEHKRQLMELGAAKQILASMGRHLTVENVQYEACGALKRLAVDDEIEVLLMEMEAASSVLRAMKQHVDVADVQGQACGVLWNLAFNGQAQLMGLNAADQILIAMEKHKTNESVQEKACGTLWKLAEIEDNNEKLIELGVIGKVLDAMDNIKLHGGVQYQACGTLWNLAVKDNNRKPLLKARAEDRVLNAMKAHRARDDILHSACGVLFNLAQTNIGLDKIVSNHAVSNDRVESFKMMQKINNSLGYSNNDREKVTTVSNRLLLASKGAVVNVVQCIQAHPDRSEVVYQAMAALNYISHDPKTIKFFLEEPGVLEEIIKASNVFIEDNGIPENAAVLLSKLMQGFYLLSKTKGFTKRATVLLTHKVIEKFVAEATTTMLSILRTQTNNPFFQTKAMSFFNYAYSYVAYREKEFQQQVIERRENLITRQKDIMRQDSEISSYYSGSGFFGQTRTSFFEENVSRKTAELETESKILSRPIIAQVIDKITTVLGHIRADERGLAIGLRLLKKMLRDGATFPQNEYFRDIQAQVLSKTSAFINSSNLFNAENRPNLHVEALWVVRFFIQYGGKDILDAAILADLPNFISNRLQTHQGLTFQAKMLSIVTMNLIIMKHVGPLSAIIDLDEVTGTLRSLLASGVSAALAGSEDAINSLKSILSLLSSPKSNMDELLLTFVQSNGMKLLLDILKITETDVKRFNLIIDVLNVFNAITIRKKIGAVFIKKASFNDILKTTIRLNRLVLQQALGYVERDTLSVITKPDSIKMNTISRRKGKKKSLKKPLTTPQFKPLMKSLGRKGIDSITTTTFDMRVALPIIQNVCLFFQNLGRLENKLCNYLFRNEEIFAQLNYLSSLGNAGQAYASNGIETLKILKENSQVDTKERKSSQSLGVSI